MQPLIGVKELLTASIETFRENWNNFVIMGLLPGVASFIYGILIGMATLGGVMFFMAGGGSSSTPVGLLTIFAILLTAVFVGVVSWFQLAMIKMALVDGKMEVKEALAETKSFVWPFILVMILVTVLVGLGMIALVIPGIVAAVWFAFVSVIFLVEGKRGMDALRASRELVRDYWWPVAGRVVMLGLLMGLISGLVTNLLAGDNESAAQLISSALTVVFGPIASLYMVYLYRDLKRVKEGVVA